MVTRKSKKPKRAEDVIPKEVLDELPSARRIIRVPDHLPGLFCIAWNLCAVEADTRKLLRQQGVDADGLFRFARAADGVKQAHPARAVRELSGQREGPAGREHLVRPPVFGCYKEYPVWSVLWFTNGYPDSEKEARTIYEALFTHFLAAGILLGEGEGLDRPRRFYEAGKLLRKLQRPDHAWLCQRIGVRINNKPDAVRESLLSCRDSLYGGEDKEEAHGCAAFAQIIRLAHGLEGGEEFAKRAPGHRRGNRIGRTRYRFDVLEPDHSQFWSFMPADGHAVFGSRGVVVDVELPRGDDADFVAGQGVDPWEYGHYDQGFVDASVIDANLGIVGDKDPKSLPPLQTLFATARARARHVAMSAQRLPVAQQRVRLAEIADFVELLDKAYVAAKNHEPPSKRGREERMTRLQALLLVAASFVTGATPRDFRSAKLPIIETIGQLPEEYTLALNREKRMWIRPYDPPSRAPMTKAEDAGAMETWPRVVFPDVWGVGDKDEIYSLQTLEAHWPTTYENHWKAVIADFKGLRVREKWLKLGNVSRMLPSWCRSLEEGDHLPWRLLFGDQDALASTHHFYTAYDRKALAEKYKCVMESLAEQIGLKAREGEGKSNHLFAWKPMIWNAPHSVVGDDRVARIESLQSLVQKSRNAVREVSDDTPFEAHNAHATYLGLVLALVTGYRAVRTPFVDVSAIDRDTGVMCLQEKDRHDGAHSRFVILPQAVREQLDIYLRQLHELWIKLPASQRASLTVEATKTRDRSAFGTPRFQLDLTSTLFLFERSATDSYHAVEFTGRRLKQRLDDLAPGHWPVENAGRHLLRTYLTEHGADATMINTIMGHASYGEEPWAPTSSIDPHVWRERLLPQLKKLLGVIGFKVAGRG